MADCPTKSPSDAARRLQIRKETQVLSDCTNTSTNKSTGGRHAYGSHLVKPSDGLAVFKQSLARLKSDANNPSTSAYRRNPY